MQGCVVAQFSPSQVVGASAGETGPGDRLELSVSGAADLFLLPPHWDPDADPIDAVEDADGKPMSVTVHPHRREIAILGAQTLIGSHWPSLWLECQSPGRYRLAIEEVHLPPVTTDGELGKEIEEDTSGWLAVLGGSHPADSLQQFQLGLRSAKLAAPGGFDRLICLPLLRDMETLEHQVRTAKTVLRRLRGRAMLCDEVGLGKTIEAGLIASELICRGLVRSMLVLVPPSLVEQWQGELTRKFSISCTSYDDPAFRAAGADAWAKFDRVITSLHTAKRDPHRAAICNRKWDLVIVDEAHHLRNRTTQSWRLASEIQKQYMLLLTATPVQNNLDELFNLVTLLEPGLLSTQRTFQHRFVDRKDKLTPRNVDQLHSLLEEVMVRNRRSTVGLSFTRRFAQTEKVELSDDERRLYDRVAEFVRRGLNPGEGRKALNRMVLTTLQLALGSSSRAAAAMLRNLAEGKQAVHTDLGDLQDLARQAKEAPAGAKVRRLLGLLESFPKKIVVFTQFRATQELLSEQLLEAGHDVALFHGGLSRLEKERAIAQFRGHARVLLTSDAGSEGRNLQFAQGICNFDLPWNPMKIEQRIGRLSRIGQTRDVHVFNLVAAGTVEAAVLHLLEAKLSMFELVIGEIDMILGNLDDEREFDEVVTDLWAESHGVNDFERRMEELGNRLIEAKEAYLRQRAHDDKLFGNRFAPEA